jgi:hypothetical protein
MQYSLLNKNWIRLNGLSMIRQRQETLLLPWTPCTIKKNFPRWWWNQTETNDP